MRNLSCVIISGKHALGTKRLHDVISGGEKRSDLIGRGLVEPQVPRYLEKRRGDRERLKHKSKDVVCCCSDALLFCQAKSGPAKFKAKGPNWC